MKIIVECKSEILGNSIFWQGNANEIDKIRNLPARSLAKQVAKDGVERKLGMWIVKEQGK